MSASRPLASEQYASWKKYPKTYAEPTHQDWQSENAALRERVAELEEALRSAADELGVPQPGYLAPVANAADILRAALAKEKP